MRWAGQIGNIGTQNQEKGKIKSERLDIIVVDPAKDGGLAVPNECDLL